MRGDSRHANGVKRFFDDRERVGEGYGFEGEYPKAGLIRYEEAEGDAPLEVVEIRCHRSVEFEPERERHWKWWNFFWMVSVGRPSLYRGTYLRLTCKTKAAGD